ncbi:uncharacterized protein LOC119375592 [Rhipicephalus sanguineus]|uniref:uncharacterized protein LOC119375592 n=1 Tax=Rhipicephalus sanguineus TaxID=34632 RepID=UPI001893D8BF|nr:uncharacterized protein LOC119375592 [Rhipicephalus sanguineus]
MAFRRSLVALILMASYGVTVANTTGCDFSGIDLDGAVDKMLGLLAQYRYPDIRGFRMAFRGLETGDPSLTGLDKIRRFGPIQPYCVNGTRQISVDVIDRGDLTLSLPWRACSGHEGTVNLRAGLSRFTLIFRFEATGLNQDAILAYEGSLVPVIVLEPQVYIDGAGSELKAATMIISKILPGVTQYYYNIFFLGVFQAALLKSLGVHSE